MKCEPRCCVKLLPAPAPFSVKLKQVGVEFPIKKMNVKNEDVRRYASCRGGGGGATPPATMLLTLVTIGSQDNGEKTVRIEVWKIYRPLLIAKHNRLMNRGQL